MIENEPPKEQVLVVHEGDLRATVRMMAAARLIREHHRKARITFLTTPEYEGLVKYCPYFNAVEASLRDTAKKGFFERVKLARASKFDFVYDLCGSDAARKLKGAMRLSRGQWIDGAPDPKSPDHPAEQMADRLGNAGIGRTGHQLGEAPPPMLDWVDFVAKRSRTLEPAYFGLQGRYALFAPAGDEFQPAFRWPKDRWASLAHELKEQGVEPVIVGGPSTREIGRYIAHVTPGARDLTGRANLVQLAGLGRKASFSFGEDVDLLHLLVAAGSPAVMFHPGAEPPHMASPRGPESVILMHAPTLAQISVAEAVQSMRVAGGFARSPEAA
ncbi:glycosyltransferase family 9 protein [Glycocaulis sp.]|uniref:glycosyltransferase family 9 protein n=1 Tax=Glycocaulis sp. TaxID=1969725 RepID=UPI003D1C7747